MKIIPQFDKRFFNFSKFIQLFFPLIITMFFVQMTNAQDLSLKAQRQLKSLLEEKASRTAEQRKINSQIWYAYKMDKGDRITPKVSTLRTNVQKDANGMIKVKMLADVRPSLISALEERGCEILQSHKKDRVIIATLPLDKVEQIAELSDIQYINLWVDPILNSNYADELYSKETEGPTKGHSAKEKNIKHSVDREDINEKLRAYLAPALIGAVTSEGDVTHQANLVRSNYNVTGAGIKIGVLSDSYDLRPTGANAADDVLSGDLPGPGNPNGYLTPVTVLSELTSSNFSPSDEGRAMLQIIHDVAPGAELYFASGVNGESDMAQQIVDLYNAGCSIIVDDISYFAENVWGDGPITQAINLVTTNGALYFSSAGNNGNLNDGTSGVWEGDFQDGGSLALFPGGTLHDFGGGQLYNTITFPGLSNVLTWSDVFDAATNDYDMFITDGSGTNITAAGMEFSPFALELAPGGNIGERIYILKMAGAQTRALQIATNRGRLSIGTQGASNGHNAAENTITVAATNARIVAPGVFNVGNKVEFFSSDGPRRKFYNADGSEITPGNLLFGTNGGAVLQKPDITAADNVTTSVEGFNPFPGTSAAAPHAAAIAALVQEFLPTYSSTEVRDLLFNTAIDIETAGVDRDAGRGIMMPLKAIESLGISLLSSSFSEPPAQYNNSNGFIEPGEVGDLNFTLTKSANTSAFTNVNMVLTSNTNGVTIMTGEHFIGTMTGDYSSLFTFAVSEFVPCGAKLEFTITVTYDGGTLSPQTLSTTHTLGFEIPPIVGVLGSPPPTSSNFISGSGLYFGRLFGNNTNLFPSTCASPPFQNITQNSPFVLNQYHAYSFTNENQNDDLCVTVTVSKTSPTSTVWLNLVAYNSSGFIITNPVANIIGVATLAAIGVPETKTYSFVVPPGEDYLITIQGNDNDSDGTGMGYTMEVDQKFCNTSPCPSTGDIVLSPPAHVYGVDKYEGTIGQPFSQTFSTSGGSGIYQYTIGNLPPGLTLSQNSQTATLSGIPTAPYEPGGFSDPNGGIWNLIVTDGLGCTTTLDVNAYYIKINPCTPVAMPSAVTSNAPVCVGDTLKLFAFPTGQGPFTYEWSGPGGTFINEDTGTPSVINPVPGVYSVTISNFCGSVQSTHLIDLNTPPVVNISGPYNLNTDPGLCTAIITDVGSLFSLVSASGTPAPSITFDFNPNTQFPVGLSTVPVSATNTCGTDQATIDIKVTDAELPVALCKDINIEVSDVFATVLASDIDGGSSDACGVALRLVNGQQGGNSINSLTEGLQLVNLTVIDFNGNTATCDAEVTVVKDLCPDGDDAIDSDNAGLPDACDCYPNDAFNDDIILNNGENPGMDFDGTDDFLTIPNDPLLIPTTGNSMTFEAWINPDEVSGFQAIATSANVGTLSTYHFAINLQNDKVRVITLSSSLVVSNASIPANAWTHIAVVFTAHPTTPSLSTTEIYINGVSDNLVTGSFQAGNFGYPIILGNIDEFNLPYNGSLEDVRFWSSARTAAEIQLLKDRELSGMEADLLAYYNFGDGISGGDNTALTSVKDLSPNAFDASLSGFAQNGSGSNWINGNVPLERFYQDTLSPCIGCPDGIAMDFDGVDDQITIPNENDLVPTNNNSMTFEAWINPDQVTGFQSIVSSANNLSVYNLAIYLLNDRVRVTASSGKLVLSNASIPVNVWTHVAVVFTANPTTPSLSTIEIYINGVLDNSLTDSFESSNLGSPIILGNINGANWIYNGKMDELRFWSSTRTMGQISNYMNTQLTGAEENLVAYYNFNTGIPGGDNSSLTMVPDGTKYERDGTLNGFAKMSTGSNWVASSNMLTAPENTALSFDGIDDYLSIPNQANLIPTETNAVTVEAWVFPEKASGISMLYSSGIFPNLDHQIFLDGSQLFVTGNGLGGLTANTSIPTFEWSHIAVVFNMTETRLYINGQLDNIRPQSLTTNNQGFDITFGSQANGLPSSWNFLGKMDDVRIWNEARSDDQIQENFLQEQSGSEYELAAYFNFNEGSPENDNSAINSLTDLTGNGTAILNGFAKTGTISNWVLSPFRFSDVDGDGKQDFCDDCIAPKDLLLRNLNLDGTYRATETITLGDGLNFPTGGVLTLRAPMIRVPNDVHIPNGALINVIEEGCEE